jgi:hypothetical protein
VLKIRHEAVVEILQNEPKLVLSLLVHSGLHLRFGPLVTTIIADSNLSDRDPDKNEYIRSLFSDPNPRIARWADPCLRK